jgi:hypothetical protein
MTEEILEGAIENKSRENGVDDVSPIDMPAAERIELRDAVSEQPEVKFDEVLSKIAPATPAAVSVSDHVADAKSLSEMTDEESKVQKLLDLASTKGVVHAVKVAQSLGDYYALDRMHDELSYKLYQGLLERGLIEKE